MTRRLKVGAAIVLASAGYLASACTAQESGEPRPTPSTSPPGTSIAPTASPQSVDDLDMCSLLRPEDIPVDPGQGGTTSQTPEWDGQACSNTVQEADPFNVIVAIVARSSTPFSEFTPPAGGESVEVSGRPAWVGKNTSDEKTCIAFFGVADGNIGVTVTDETERGVDPCETAIELAEIVIERTPPPNE